MQSSSVSRVYIQLTMILSFLHDLFVDKFNRHHHHSHLTRSFHTDRSSKSIKISILFQYAQIVAVLLKIVCFDLTNNNKQTRFRLALYFFFHQNEQHESDGFHSTMPRKLTIVFQHTKHMVGQTGFQTKQQKNLKYQSEVAVFLFHVSEPLNYSHLLCVIQLFG